MMETITLDHTCERSATRKRVLLVDDHAVVRKGLAVLINDEADLHVCGEAHDVRSAQEAAANLRPDVAVVDWSLGRDEAASLIQVLRSRFPEMPVLVLSMHDEQHYAERVLSAGASGYVMKREASNRVIDGIRKTLAGGFYFTDRAIEVLPDGTKAVVRQRMTGRRHSPEGDQTREVRDSEKSDLVIAPHPDDETNGCGGTIRIISNSGANVDLALMTRGELGHEEGPNISQETQAALALERSAEALEAGKTLGVRRISFLDGAESRLREQPHLAHDLVTLLTGCEYRRVFCPWQRDDDEDHAATFTLFQAALRMFDASPQIWLYEVWTPLRHNMLVSIDQTIRQKRAAIESYRSQLKRRNCLEAFIGLSSYRAASCPPANFAEAFFVCDKQEFLSL